MKKTMMLAVLAAAVTTAAHAQEAVSGTANPYPWFGSLKKTEVNVRSGPGNQYPILWVYQRAGYPVEVLTKYDNYYKLRDVEGEEGWVYIGMVSRKPTALVGGKTPSNLMRRADAGSQLVARLAPGVVVELNDCKDVANVGNLCQVETPGAKGYILKSHLDMVP